MRSVLSPIFGLLLLTSSALVSLGANPGLVHGIQSQILGTTPQGDGWAIEIVDHDAPTNDVSVVTDSNNMPHISYLDYDDALGQYFLKYVNRSDDRWSGVGLDYLGSTIILRTAITLDGSDRPHIAYNDNDDGHGVSIEYTKWTGAEWISETVVSGRLSNAHVTLALDSKDYPHITYPETMQNFKHANWTGNGWNIEDVDMAFPPPSSIVLDSNDYPHLGYANGDVKVARWNGVDWDIQAIFGIRSEYVSLDLDSNNNPHVVFSTSVDYDLYYAKWNGIAWEIEAIRSDGKIGCYLALDKYDGPHLVCKQFDLDPMALQYATLVNGKWQFETVDWIAHHSHDFSIAIDSNCDPHLAYHAAVNHVKYATKHFEAPSKEITLDIDPDTLNLKSRGRWITAYLRTEGGIAADIDASSLLLNDILSPEWWDLQDSNTLMAKFNRADVQAILPVSDSVDIKVTGQWKDGETFEVHDIIRVIMPGTVPLVPRDSFLGNRFPIPEADACARRMRI